MKNTGLLWAVCCLLLTSCSYQQFSAAATGSSLGGMFGSSIGGLMGGYRGHQIGTITGMATGAAIAIAATTPKEEKSERYNERNDDYESDYSYNESDYPDNSIEYGHYEPAQTNKYTRIQNAQYPLEVTQIRFSDANNNRYLESNERASLEMTVYNQSEHTLYNVAPQISCDKKRINISPTAIISEVGPNQGFRYRAEVLAEKLKDGNATFQVAFGNGKEQKVVKTFRIRTQR